MPCAPDIPFSPDACLRHHVDDAITGVTEASTATGARIWLFFGVNPMVAFEVLGPGEPLATNLTHIWSFICVGVHVYLELVVICEGLVARETMFRMVHC